MTDWFDALEADGYTLLPGVLSDAEVDAARAGCAALLADPGAGPAVLAAAGGPAYGARNVLRHWPGAADLARLPRLAGPLSRVLGPAGGVVRGLYFDKPPGASWALPWHRDATVAVKAHRPPADGFGKPTTKSGVPHVEAPPALLDAMVTARVHLDAMTARNGPLRVVPGSHRTAADAPAADRPAVTVHCHAGDVLLMRPLLLHASGHCDADHDGHRRIVHLECAPRPELPGGYEWYDFVPIGDGRGACVNDGRRAPGFLP